MSNAEHKQTGAAKTARNPIKIVPLQERLRKPQWIRVKSGSGAGYNDVKRVLREHRLHTVCEEASCPNIGECFSKGTATFMILGDVCTRRCPFCDVAHGKPQPPDANEPENLARSIGLLNLKYAVITSVDRDDLRDGGAQHFADCLTTIRAYAPATRLEILVPDFCGRMETAMDALSRSLPDVFNHNLETVPHLYSLARPGADYAHSLRLLKEFKARFPHVLTKSGLMLGLGETDEEVLQVMRDLRAHGVNMLTIGQYLQPSDDHLPVLRYVPPETFASFGQAAKKMGF
ncbi:MAG: lipoyl synthase, partial [Gallionella sp.]|nr:lipoyl synthase [Gallionella sp.]